MRASILKLLILLAFSGLGQEVPYQLKVPKGWGTEQFNFPLSFAPQIEYRGIEDIRFLPGWAKKDSSDYWSYAFLWYLEGSIMFDAVIVEGHIKHYYEGLIAANRPNISKENLIPVKVAFNSDAKLNDDKAAYVGSIEMTDYMTLKKIVLNCKAHWRTCPGQEKTVLFFELSPKPLTHKVWDSLDKLWIDFKCKK